MWIAWNILAMLCIAGVQFCNRYFGMGWNSYLIYCGTALLITGWALPLGYQLAPSLLHAWFLGIGVLSVLGFAGSYWLFHDPVSVHHYIGAAIILIGSAVLILP
jgi:drug/metabolite transporter (DMT)-like permease